MCKHPGGAKITIAGHELSPCVMQDTEIYRNVTVIISKCKRCGAVEVSWMRQENTEEVRDGQQDD